MIFNLFLKVFLPKNYNDSTQEKEVESRINEIMLKGPIDINTTKDDFIRLVIKIYGNDSKYKPYKSRIKQILGFLILLLIIILIGIGIYTGIKEYNFYLTHGIGKTDIRKKMFLIWKLLSNIEFILIIIYILFNLYENIRKIIRHEIKKSRFLKNTLKPFLLLILIPFTWFIGSAIGSIYNIFHASINNLIK